VSRGVFADEIYAQRATTQKKERLSHDNQPFFVNLKSNTMKKSRAKIIYIFFTTKFFLKKKQKIMFQNTILTVFKK
jgi:hypothetical protein